MKSDNALKVKIIYKGYDSFQSCSVGHQGMQNFCRMEHKGLQKNLNLNKTATKITEPFEYLYSGHSHFFAGPPGELTVNEVQQWIQDMNSN